MALFLKEWYLNFISLSVLSVNCEIKYCLLRYKVKVVLDEIVMVDGVICVCLIFKWRAFSYKNTWPPFLLASNVIYNVYVNNIWLSLSEFARNCAILRLKIIILHWIILEIVMVKVTSKPKFINTYFTFKNNVACSHLSAFG